MNHQKPQESLTIHALLHENAELKERISSLEGKLEEEVRQARKEAQRQREKARKDPLTGAYNRRGLRRNMRKVTGDYSVILIDIDHFKAINDTYGHDKGDSVLRGLVRTIAQNIREQDILARYGGEEFLIIMPGCDANTARRKTEYLQDIIGAQSFHDTLKLPTPLTFSAGIAYARKEESHLTAIQRADENLYTAKKTRNTICH